MQAPTFRWTFVVAAIALAVSGCGGDAADVAQPLASIRYTAGDVPVIVPGSPGEPTVTVAPGETGMIQNAGRWNDADVGFVQKMVPHHTQALQIAALAPERASDDRVLALAERIQAAQGPEIEAMQGWLAQQGLPPADPDEHGHAGMAGMVSDGQLFALRTATGEEFDRLFLEAMTQHHEGAISMATGTVDAVNPVVLDLMQDVVVGQSIEVSRMAEVQENL